MRHMTIYLGNDPSKLKGSLCEYLLRKYVDQREGFPKAFRNYLLCNSRAVLATAPAVRRIIPFANFKIGRTSVIITCA